MEKICNNCQVTFITAKSDKKYCSTDCRVQFNRNKIYKYTNTCPDCGKVEDRQRKMVNAKVRDKLGNQRCRSCAQYTFKKPLILDYTQGDFWVDNGRFFRNCPQCNSLIEHKTRYYALKSSQRGTKCPSCCVTGESNGKIQSTLRKYNVDTLDAYETLLPAKTLYYKKVWQITELQNLSTLKFFTRRGRQQWSLDHIYPIAAGFRNNIPPELIGDVQNLQMLHHIENSTKSDKILHIPKHINEYLENTK